MKPTIETLRKAAPLLKIRTLARAAGMPEGTLKSKLNGYSKKPLTEAEADAIDAVLKRHGIGHHQLAGSTAEPQSE